MTHTIDGIAFKNLVDYAVRNLNNHIRVVNQLNVFPVPDGDTGTNMVTTIRKGLMAVGEDVYDLPSVSRKFAHSIVFEARGNSGVIVSQFFRGVAEKFHNVQTIDGALLIEAFEHGVESAYASVATPVEGTMLTVLREATEAVKQDYSPEQSLDDIIARFTKYAKISLDNTPELLPVLKESGVVDSGGAGIVYLFEGMQKYLKGEELESSETLTDTPVADYDAFDRNSQFPYGYCTELLIQLQSCKEPFSREDLQNGLCAIGDSLVISVNDDKVRIHVHTKFPEQAFSLCHKYGEFLSIKVENMTVQHSDVNKAIQCSTFKSDSSFAVVAVAYDPKMQKLFLEMGADVVICCEENVSTKEYLDAFQMANKENILVFPNGSDAILSAMQAKKLYEEGNVTVLSSRSVAECYAALPAIDFAETDTEKVVDRISEIISHLYVVSVAKRKNPICYKNETICRDEYYSFSGKELLVIGKTIEGTTLETIIRTVKKQDYEIITIFHKRAISADQIESLVEAVACRGVYAEVFTVATDSLPCELSISFE